MSDQPEATLTKEEALEALKELIAKGKTKKAIEQSIEWSDILDQDEDDFIQLSARLVRIKKQETSGVLSTEAIQLAYNKINDDFMTLLDIVEVNTPARKGIKYALFGLVLLLLTTPLWYAAFTKTQLLLSEVVYQEGLNDKPLTKQILTKGLEIKLHDRIEQGREKLFTLYHQENAVVPKDKLLGNIQQREFITKIDTDFSDNALFASSIGKTLRNLMHRHDFILVPSVYQEKGGYTLQLSTDDNDGHKEVLKIDLGENLSEIDIDDIKEKMTYHLLSYYNSGYATLMDFEEGDAGYNNSSSNWKSAFSSLNDKITLLEQGSGKDQKWNQYVLSRLYKEEAKLNSTNYDKFLQVAPKLIQADQACFGFLTSKIEDVKALNKANEAAYRKKDGLIQLFENSVDPITQQALLVLQYKEQATHLAQLIAFEKVEDQWTQFLLSEEVNIGKNGFAAVDEKQEGDGKAPSGVYDLGKAFGYKKDIDTKLDFLELTAQKYWITEPTSAAYNQILDYLPPDKPVHEIMRREDHLHKYGIIVRYNMDNPVPGDGSAITIHVERAKGKKTAGCVSLNEDQLKQLITWLDKDKHPQIIMGTYDWLLSAQADQSI